MKPLEDRFAWYVGSLRQQRHEAELKDAIIPELVANLAVRTKAFREELTRSTTAAMSEVFARLRDTDKLNNIVSHMLGDPSGRVLNAILDKLPPERADTFPTELSKAVSLMRSPIGAELSKRQLERAERAFENDFSLATKESHIAALLTAPIPDNVIAGLAHLQWSLVIRPSGSFILGDVGPTFKIQNTSRAKSAPVGVYEYDAAFLPISDSHLLAGLDQRPLSGVSLVDEVNQFSCSCSQTFFISAFNTSREQEYVIQLGSTAELLDKDAVTSLTDQIMGLLGGV